MAIPKTLDRARNGHRFSTPRSFAHGSVRLKRSSYSGGWRYRLSYSGECQYRSSYSGGCQHRSRELVSPRSDRAAQKKASWVFPWFLALHLSSLLTNETSHAREFHYLVLDATVHEYEKNAMWFRGSCYKCMSIDPIRHRGFPNTAAM